jgi:hypothetical protein
MKTSIALGCVGLLVVACGGGKPANEAKTETSAAPSASAPATASPPASGGGDVRCIAGMTNKRPQGWKEAGFVVITVDGDEPKTFEIHDETGKVVGTNAAPKGREGREALRNAACRVGGFLVFLEKPAKGATSVKAIVLKPAKEDEAGDLAMMCKEPELPAGLDESQKLRIAVEIFEERLTSTKWRGWLFDMNDETRRGADDAAHVATKKKRGAELQAAAGKGTCWFGAALSGGGAPR